MTLKQQRFCDEYLIDLNATQAALRAGYSGQTAANASRWLDEGTEKYSADMADYIRRRLDEKQAKLIAKQDEILEYLTSVMRREKCESVVVTVASEESWYEPDDHGTMRKHTRKTESPQIVEIPAKLSDANKAAELLGRRYAMFTDNVVTEVELPQIIEDL